MPFNGVRASANILGRSLCIMPSWKVILRHRDLELMLNLQVGFLRPRNNLSIETTSLHLECDESIISQEFWFKFRV